MLFQILVNVYNLYFIRDTLRRTRSANQSSAKWINRTGVFSALLSCGERLRPCQDLLPAWQEHLHPS